MATDKDGKAFDCTFHAGQRCNHVDCGRVFYGYEEARDLADAERCERENDMPTRSAAPTPEPLTDAQLADLKAAVEKMTPGPWWIGPGPFFHVYMNDGEATPLYESWYGHDAYGIVALVNAFPALLALLEQRTAALREMMEAAKHDSWCFEQRPPAKARCICKLDAAMKLARAALLPSEGTQEPHK